MRPARMLSRWAKMLPWAYAERRQPTRAEDVRQAIEDHSEAVAIEAQESDMHLLCKREITTEEYVRRLKARVAEDRGMTTRPWRDIKAERERRDTDA